MKRICILIKLTKPNQANATQLTQGTDTMKVITGLKKMYKKLSPYNRRKLQEANFKYPKKKKSIKPKK